MHHTEEAKQKISSAHKNLAPRSLMSLVYDNQTDVVKKTCSHCNEVLPLSAFGKDSSNRTGLRCYCKICAAKKRAKYYAENRDLIRKQRTECRKRNYEKYLATEKGYRARHREECNVRALRHYYKNRVYYWANDSIRKHIQKGWDVKITHQELIDLAKTVKVCPICGVELAWECKGKKQLNSPTVDRIDNESFMDTSNIWIICAKCNTTKYDRSMGEFVEYCKKVIKLFDKTDIQEEMGIRADPSKEIPGEGTVMA